MHFSRLAGIGFLFGALVLAGVRGEAGVGAEARARLLMNSGLAHERLGQHQEALRDFTQALAMRGLTPPDRVRAIFDRGVALDALGRTKDAIRDYSEAIRLDTHFAPALNNRANAYRRLGRLTDAKHDYLIALTCPDVAREYPYFGLAQIAQAMGDIATARDYYGKALAVNPAYALAAQNLAALPREAAPAPLVLLRPPPVMHAPPKRVQEAEATAFVLHPPSAKHPPPVQTRMAVPRPVQTVAKQEAAPALRQAILDNRAKPTPEFSRAQIQLGAFHDQATATEGWNKLVTASGGLLSAMSPNIVPVDLPGKGRLWRLRSSVADLLAARKLCAALSARGVSCMVVRD
ncbi:MAG: tetratricopeptide repeat protein [Alphaproteobacteria bacterium]|nr:tetratricopeptide repeat protein [Alphaproteobacteria bacterium]MDE2163059.1 tetratricopeptide repeat protein [Alphaproteobacteria bacterium]